MDMVRKFLISMALCAVAFAAGGFVPSGSAAQTQPLSVKEALKLRDDSFVVIDGKIKSQLRHEHYRFADQNGDSIEVEIDDDVWRGVSVDENTLVRISGEIDKDFTKTTIDVKNIKILNSK
jgi:protein ygiW